MFRLHDGCVDDPASTAAPGWMANTEEMLEGLDWYFEATQSRTAQSLLW